MYTGRSADISAVRIDLMRAHVVAVDRDGEGIVGLLSQGQVFDYHAAVFADHGLPPGTFGGTPFFGYRQEAYLFRGLWCAQCDR